MTFSHPPDDPSRQPDDDLGHVAPALGGGLALLKAPVSAATWRAVSQATVGFPLLLAAGIIVLTFIPLSIGLLVLGVGFPMLVATLVTARWAGRVEAKRLGAQLDVTIRTSPTANPRTLLPWSGWKQALSDGASWSATGYFAVAFLLNTAQVVVAWSAGALITLAAVPFSAWGDHLSVLGKAVLAAVGLASPWLWAALNQALALAHVRLARATLSPTSHAAVTAANAAARRAEQDAAKAQELAQHLDETRSRAVGAADDDRRRIERDLHDGAQQRLVALGVELGIAKRQAATDPNAAAAALDHAHLEIKETLTELRDLVRGIHPAVLTDRGFDAALSALAARHPVPVTVWFTDAAAVAGASRAAQAAAYFVVAEALTNSARHSGASAVEVTAAVVDGRLRVLIADDGHGSATETPGGGLDGLRSRVEALDGTFSLDSPAGGGTQIVMEVPCAS